MKKHPLELRVSTDVAAQTRHYRILCTVCQLELATIQWHEWDVNEEALLRWMRLMRSLLEWPHTHGFKKQSGEEL